MSGNIQLIPPGLLSLLGVKNFGDNPNQLGNTYAPVLPMIPWAMLGKAETLQAGFSAGAIGGNLTGLFTSSAVATPGTAFTVPGNEVWYVHDLTVTLVPGAAATRFSSFSIGYLLDALGTPKYLAVAQQAVVLTNDAAVLSARDFFVPQGAIFGFSAVVANAAATNVGSIAALITRLPT